MDRDHPHVVRQDLLQIGEDAGPTDSLAVDQTVQEQAPIEHLTNGVHAGSWVGDPVKALLAKHLGADWLDRVHDPATWAAAISWPAR